MTDFRLLLSVFIIALACSCSEADFSSDGRYIYSVDMSDTSAVYDLWVTVRTPVRNTADSLKMTICITSPDRHQYAVDTWVVPIGKDLSSYRGDGRLSSRVSAFSQDIRALYRSKVRPRQSGEWILSFTADPAQTDGIWVSAEKHKD